MPPPHVKREANHKPPSRGSQSRTGDFSLISAEDPQVPELIWTVVAGQTGGGETPADSSGWLRTRDERGIESTGGLLAARRRP
jgi:hypothetical protein